MITTRKEAGGLFYSVDRMAMRTFIIVGMTTRTALAIWRANSGWASILFTI